MKSSNVASRAAYVRSPPSAEGRPEDFPLGAQRSVRQNDRKVVQLGLNVCMADTSKDIMLEVSERQLIAVVDAMF